MVFKGRTRVRYYYSPWGYTRGNGKTWHGGIDIEGIDDPTIYMPTYNGKKISGTVTRARIVTDKSNPTWEWGYYVCVQLDANQTPDPVNFLYFCHCDKLLVKVGQHVSSGDALAIMGNTGNAKLANPPFAHCHLEVRRTATSKGLDPTAYAGCPNKVGTYGSALNTNPDHQPNPVEVRIEGIDLSKYQGDVDFQAVAKAGKKFAMLRALSSNNNGPYIDPYFEKYYKGAKEAGLDVGAYFFTYAENEEKQNAEFELLLTALEGKTFEYPVAYDIEDVATAKAAGSNMTTLAKRALDILDQKGYYPMLYTYTNFKNKYLDMNVLEPYDLWLADTRSGINAEGKCDMWQYAQGHVPGVNGDCDLNVCFKKYVVDLPEPVEPDTTPENPGSNDDHDSTPEKGTHVIVSVPHEKLSIFQSLATSLNVPMAYSDIAVIGAMSNGDASSCKNIAVENNVLFVTGYISPESNLQMATVGPMKSSISEKFKNFADASVVGYHVNHQCAIGPMSKGDINAVIAKANEQKLTYVVKEY